MSVKKISALIATPFIALALSACSLDANDDGDTYRPTQTMGSGDGDGENGPFGTPSSPDESPSSPDDPTTSEYSPATPSFDETTPSPDDTTPSYGGDYGASKPSREEVKAGIGKMLENQGATEQLRNLGATDEQLDRAYQCIADDIYDQIPDDDLRTIAQGDPTSPIDSASRSTLSDSAYSCGQKLGSEINSN